MGCICGKPKRPKPAVQPQPSLRVATPPLPASIDPIQSPIHLHISQPARLVVKSRFSLQDVQSADFTPHNTNRQVFKYSCPICLKYLTTVLVATCCKNYLCHFCVEEFRSRETTETIVRCPMCNSETLTLEDVNPEAEVKIYSDSPFSTHTAGKSSVTKWVPTLAIVEENEKLAQELEAGNSPLSSPRNGLIVPQRGLAVTA